MYLDRVPQTPARHGLLHCLCVLGRDSSGNVVDPWRLSELLMDVGAMSVTVDDAYHGTDQEIPVLHDHATSKVEQSFQGSLHHAPCTMHHV